MKVKELIEKLNNYNQEANFEVVVEGKPEEFEICFGTSEGCTKQNCDQVCLYINTEEEAC